MLFWLSSTGAPDAVVNVGAGICFLALFINSLELIFRDWIGNSDLGLISRQPDMRRCQAAATQRGYFACLAPRSGGVGCWPLVGGSPNNHQGENRRRTRPPQFEQPTKT